MGYLQIKEHIMQNIEHLPIFQGERPLFAALPLLEKAYRNQQIFNNMFASIPEKDILIYVTEIYTIIELLKKRQFTHNRDSSKDLFDLLKDLPLFFNEQQVYNWEIKKIWLAPNFLTYNSLATEYETSFNTPTPSLLYQTNTPNQETIWHCWFKSIDFNELINTLEFSAQRLYNWNQQRTDVAPLKQNINTLSKKIKINKQQTNHWYYFHLLGQQDSDVWNKFLTETKSNNYQELILIWEKALALKHNSLNSLIYKDAPLVTLGFFKTPKKSYNKWNDYWKEISRLEIPNINTQLINSKNIINSFLKSFNQKSLPIDWFNYIKNFDSIMNLIDNTKNGKILIYGDKFTGKKTFIRSVLNHLKIQGYHINDDFYEKNDLTKNKQLLLNDKILSTFKKSALIIPNGDKSFDLSDQTLQYPCNSLQIWTINDISDVDKDFLKSFDFIFQMQSPSVEQRFKIAKEQFPDHAIAFKVAQSVKDYPKIIKIAQICHKSKNFSWNNISMIINNFHKATNYSNYTLELNQLEPSQDNINLVGFPLLQKELNNLTSFYKKPQEYLTIGAKANKGMLLIGPPGTGKTHFVKQLSKMACVPIFAPDTSLLVNNIKLIEQLFKELKSQSPCILFLDEIDTIIQNPTSSFGTNLEKQKIINTFLAQVDGIENNDGILIIGATHRKANFDPAATRAGRLNKIITLSLPDENARIAIWKEHMKNKIISSNITHNQLANLSIGFSCADIMEALNKAAIHAVENNKKEIDLQSLMISCDEVFWGYSDKSLKINPHEIQMTAYHEAGHAILALYHGYTVPRITIRPRNESLGATQIINDDGSYSMSKVDIENRIQILLGGLCAEKIQFSNFQNGGTSDLSQAHKIFIHSICYAGLGNCGVMSMGEQEYWSNERRLQIENEEQQFMKQQLDNTESILHQNKQLLDEIAQDLLTHKELSGDTVSIYKQKIINTQPPYKHNTIKDNHILHNNEKI